MATEHEHENAFFSKANQILKWWLTGKGKPVDYDDFEILVENFHGEIISYCRAKTGDDRSKYMSHVEKRLKDINDRRPVSPKYLEEIGLGLWMDLAGEYNFLLKKLDELKELYGITNIEEQNHIPSNRIVKESTSLEDLFKYPELAQDCIDILKKIEPPVLNSDGEYIGRPLDKGVFCVWISALDHASFINKQLNDKAIARILSTNISSFTISDSLFRKPSKRAEDNYKSDILTLVSQLKQKIPQRK